MGFDPVLPICRGRVYLQTGWVLILRGSGLDLFRGFMFASLIARLLLVWAMIMPGCFPHNRAFDKELSSFARAAYSEGRFVDMSKIRIVFSDFVQFPVLAMCFPDKETPIIMVSRMTYDQSDDVYKEAVIWHELGHCVLDRMHTTDLKDDGHPVSLMYPNTFTISDRKYWAEHKAEYIHELFKKDIDCILCK